MNVNHGFLLKPARSNADSCQVENCVRRKLNKFKKRSKYIFSGLYSFHVFYYIFSFIIACHFNYNHDTHHLPLENYPPVTEWNRRNLCLDSNRNRDYGVLDNCYCYYSRCMNLVHHYLPIHRNRQHHCPTYSFRPDNSRLRLLVDSSRRRRQSFADSRDCIHRRHRHNTVADSSDIDWKGYPNPRLFPRRKNKTITNSIIIDLMRQLIWGRKKTYLHRSLATGSKSDFSIFSTNDFGCRWSWMSCFVWHTAKSTMHRNKANSCKRIEKKKNVHN